MQPCSQSPACSEKKHAMGQHGRKAVHHLLRNGSYFAALLIADRDTESPETRVDRARYQRRVRFWTEIRTPQESRQYSRAELRTPHAVPVVTGYSARLGRTALGLFQRQIKRRNESIIVPNEDRTFRWCQPAIQRTRQSHLSSRPRSSPTGHNTLGRTILRPDCFARNTLTHTRPHARRAEERSSASRRRYLEEPLPRWDSRSSAVNTIDSRP